MVAEGQDGQGVCALYEAMRPDVVVMDVTLPGIDGLTATRELTSRHPAKILMLSAHAVHDYVSRAFAYGTTGYALKSLPRRMPVVPAPIATSLPSCRSRSSRRRASAGAERPGNWMVFPIASGRCSISSCAAIPTPRVRERSPSASRP